MISSVFFNKIFSFSIIFLNIIKIIVSPTDNIANPYEMTVRVRIINTKRGFLTLKSSFDGFVNNEFEYPIPLKDAQSIWNRLSKKLYKTRYLLNFRSEKCKQCH